MQWVWDEKAKAPLQLDWVFAGSVLDQVPSPRSRPTPPMKET